MPNSNWRDLVLSGFDYMQTQSRVEPLVLSTPLATQCGNLPPDQQGYNYVTTQFKYKPGLSLADCKKIVQSTYYFGESLANMLNSSNSRSIPLSHKFTKQRFQAIDDVEEMCADFHTLSIYTGSNITWDQPLRVHISPASHHAVEFYFQSYSSEIASLGIRFVEQLDLITSFIEAALSSGGGGRGYLNHHYPATISGLGRFINNRGMGMEEPSEDGSVLIRTPFISSLSRDEKAAKNVDFQDDWEDADTPIASWRHTRSYHGPRQYEPR